MTYYKYTYEFNNQPQKTFKYCSIEGCKNEEKEMMPNYLRDVSPVKLNYQYRIKGTNECILNCLEDYYLESDNSTCINYTLLLSEYSYYCVNLETRIINITGSINFYVKADNQTNGYNGIKYCIDECSNSDIYKYKYSNNECKESCEGERYYIELDAEYPEKLCLNVEEKLGEYLINETNKYYYCIFVDNRTYNNIPNSTIRNGPDNYGNYYCTTSNCSGDCNSECTTTQPYLDGLECTSECTGIKFIDNQTHECRTIENKGEYECIYHSQYNVSGIKYKRERSDTNKFSITNVSFLVTINLYTFANYSNNFYYYNDSEKGNNIKMCIPECNSTSIYKYIKDENECVSECPEGYYLDYNYTNSTGRNKEYFSNRCISIEQIGYYQCIQEEDPEDKFDSYEDKYYYTINGIRKCLNECNSVYKYRKDNNECVEHCEDNYFLNKSDNNCIAIENVSDYHCIHIDTDELYYEYDQSIHYFQYDIRGILVDTKLCTDSCKNKNITDINGSYFQYEYDNTKECFRECNDTYYILQNEQICVKNCHDGHYLFRSKNFCYSPDIYPDYYCIYSENVTEFNSSLSNSFYEIESEILDINDTDKIPNNLKYYNQTYFDVSIRLCTPNCTYLYDNLFNYRHYLDLDEHHCLSIEEKVNYDCIDTELYQFETKNIRFAFFYNYSTDDDQKNQNVSIKRCQNNCSELKTDNNNSYFYFSKNQGFGECEYTEDNDYFCVYLYNFTIDGNNYIPEFIKELSDTVEHPLFYRDKDTNLKMCTDECPENYSFLYEEKKECVEECSKGDYNTTKENNSDIKVCLPCDISCKECITNSTNCIICNNSYYFKYDDIYNETRTENMTDLCYNHSNTEIVDKYCFYNLSDVPSSHYVPLNKTKYYLNRQYSINSAQPKFICTHFCKDAKVNGDGNGILCNDSLLQCLYRNECNIEDHHFINVTEKEDYCSMCVEKCLKCDYEPDNCTKCFTPKYFEYNKDCLTIEEATIEKCLGDDEIFKNISETNWYTYDNNSYNLTNNLSKYFGNLPTNIKICVEECNSAEYKTNVIPYLNNKSKKCIHHCDEKLMSEIILSTRDRKSVV